MAKKNQFNDFDALSALLKEEIKSILKKEQSGNLWKELPTWIQTIMLILSFLLPALSAYISLKTSISIMNNKLNNVEHEISYLKSNCNDFNKFKLKIIKQLEEIKGDRKTIEFRLQKLEGK